MVMNNEEFKKMDLDFIANHYGYTINQLGDLTLKELFKLHKEATESVEQEKIAINLKENVSYWRKFFKALPFFVENGFDDREIDEVLARFDAFYFYQEKPFRKGTSPIGHHEFVREGSALFGKRKGSPANYYHIESDSVYQKMLECKVFLSLMTKRYPFLENYNLRIYEVNENSEFYVQTELKNPLYVPIKALLKGNSAIIKKRMIDYFDVATNKNHAKSEDILNTLTVKAFMKDLDGTNKK